jgi:ribosomal protein S18 acetylase RimI-like enzyme
VVVRRVLPDDWPALRALRLEALADTPIGFLETLARAQAYGDEEWQYRARRGAVGGDSVQVLAFAGDHPVGTVVGFVRDGRGWLAAVYVTPARRGGALLERLVRGLTDWFRERGLDEVHLEVHEDNARAQRAYATLGFVPTGERQPYDPDPTRSELTLVAPLP